MKNNFYEFWKDCDDFGTEISFSIQGRTRFKSIIGGIVSIFCRLIALAFTALVLYQLITYSNTNYMSQLDEGMYY